MKRAAILGCLFASGIYFHFAGTFGSSVACGQIAQAADQSSADSREPVTPEYQPLRYPRPDRSSLSSSPAEDTPSVADDESVATVPTVPPIVEGSNVEVFLYFKIFRVSKKLTADAGIDLAKILEPKSRADAAIFEKVGVSTLSLREQELLAKLFAVSGAAKLLAEPTLATKLGRKVKYFSGGEVLSPGPPKDGIVTTEFRDVGTKIETTAILDDDGKLLTELRIEFSELDRSRTVTVNGNEFPGVKTNWLDLAVKLSLDETFVLGGPAYDSLLVMVTPELVVAEKDATETERPVIRDASEGPDLVRAVEHLQLTMDSIQSSLRDLTATVEKRLAVPSNAIGSVEPSLLPNHRMALPKVNQKAIDNAITAWPDLAAGHNTSEQANYHGVSSGWEQSKTGQGVYTIRIGSSLLKPLSDGSAVEQILKDDDRQLREFRVVMGPASRQEIAAESAATPEVGYGWRPNDQGGLDYYVQVSPERLHELAKGHTLNCSVHPDVKSIDKIYVFIGDEPLPRISAP